MEFKDLKSLLNTSPKVFIVTHKSPDGDAMGSSLGLAGVLKKKGCDQSDVFFLEEKSFLLENV